MQRQLTTWPKPSKSVPVCIRLVGSPKQEKKPNATGYIIHAFVAGTKVQGPMQVRDCRKRLGRSPVASATGTFTKSSQHINQSGDRQTLLSILLTRDFIGSSNGHVFMFPVACVHVVSI